MSAASVLYETDIYHEWPAPAPLRHVVACLWVRRGEGESVRVLPDGCIDIVWRPDTGAFVAGPDTGPVISSTRVDEVVVGVRLRPGAGGGALEMPLAEIRDLRVPLAEFGLDPASELHGELDPGTAVTRLTALAARLVLRRTTDRAVQAAAAALNHPHRRVDRLAAELGFSERQLRRRFHTAVGYGPKTLQRVLRLQRFRALGDLDLVAAAAQAGYADQAHLTRDCRELTGLTPGQLRRR